MNPAHVSAPNLGFSDRSPSAAIGAQPRPICHAAEMNAREATDAETKGEPTEEQRPQQTLPDAGVDLECPVDALVP